MRGASSGPRPPSGAAASVVWALLWGVVAAAGCALVAPLEPDLRAEGLLLHVAERLAGGETLYRDVLIAGGPLSVEVLALLFRTLGAEIAVARGAVMALTALGAACAFGIVRAAGAGVLAHAAGAGMAAAPALLFPELARFTAPVVALHLSLVAGLASLGARRSLVVAGTAGAWVACVGLALPDVGLALAGTLAAAIGLVAPRGRRAGRVAAFLAGGTLAFAVSSSAHAVAGLLAPLASSLAAALDGVSLAAWSEAVRPAGEAARSTLPGLARALATEESGPAGEALELGARLLFTVPVLALLAVAVRRLLVGPLPDAGWALAALLAGWLVHLGPQPDWGTLAPLLPLSLLVLLGAASPGRPRAGVLTHAAAASLVGGLALATGLASAALHAAATPGAFGPRVPLRAVGPGARAPELAGVIREVRARTRAGDPILVLGDETLLYFATGTRNPTPYPGRLPELRPGEEQRLLAALEEVRLVVISGADSGGAPGPRPPSALQQQLERHFRVVGPAEPSPPRLLLLERGPDRGPSAVDLVDHAAQARAWVRTEAGRVSPARRAPPAFGVQLHRRPLAFVLGVEGGGLDFDVELPEHAGLEADVGLAPLRGRREHWLPANAVLAVSVARGGDFERVASFHLEGGHGVESPWRPVEVDLSRFGPGPAQLRLELEPDPSQPPSSLAWWGSPRIVSRRPQVR